MESRQLNKNYLTRYHSKRLNLNFHLSRGEKWGHTILNEFSQKFGKTVLKSNIKMA